MIETSESIKTITAAMLKFQGGVSGVKRDAANSHFRSKYATLENVIDTARPVLQECGIVFIQAPGAIVDGSLEVATQLTHPESGEWMRCTMQMPLGKRDPQGTGSALTYSLRYSLMAMLGLPPTDDDGEAAMDRSEKPLNLPGVKPSPLTAKSSDKAISSAEMKRQLEEIERDLLDVTTGAEWTKCGLVWSAIMERDGWPEDFREVARAKFETSRDRIKAGKGGVKPDAIDELLAAAKPRLSYREQTEGR